ncbi:MULTISPECIES: hemolysin family protein [Lysobacter]|uniref:Hemolysin n=2 Tax=Lysobacter TaxID=68 RepID=A0A0S2DJZ7_LYSEN|nr:MULTISPECIES: hemolysin family protein [Lysobacter]ALN58848.1 hemolysin [Lysobacter enzymogenes]QCW27120.1 HlyC/CorC family transporter [Lysobacter enzymogenes]QQQ02947.1 HlyC/CorC family transporter [Lysobacter enzymogenes]UZW62415.1 hemolysin family protein [Lysobacter enzymogenes]WMT01345.1 hemolysin family protein [Lysobacter yananisis]
MLELLIVVALIVLNAFFAMSEMALMTSRKLRLKQMAETSKGARTALALAEQPDNLLSSVQIGITGIGVLTGYFGGESIGLVIAGWLSHVLTGDFAQYARPIGIGTAMALITASQVIFGELIPKRLALTNPERIASTVAVVLYTITRVASPVVRALGAINRFVLRLLGIKDDARSEISEEEIRLLVSESHEQGVIDADERKMVNRVLSLGDRTADSLMTPRTRIAWLDASASREENLAIMRESPFSRFPVYRGSDQDVLGVLEAKALLADLVQGRVPDLFGQLKEALFVSESTHALKLLEIFREEQQSVALVVDEYGDVTGLITVNDLLGAVIGRVQNADSDDQPGPVVQREDGSYLVDGALPVEELREVVGGRLPNEDEHDFNTVAGMVIAHFGRIPHVGEHFAWAGWRIEVIDLDGPRIDKLLLQPQQAKPAESGDDDATSG